MTTSLFLGKPLSLGSKNASHEKSISGSCAPAPIDPGTPTSTILQNLLLRAPDERAEASAEILERKTTAPVASISVDPDVGIADQSATGKVRLFNPAPAGGTVVTLGAQQGQIVIPPSVKVRAGHKTATFKITTMDIGVPVVVRICASTVGQGARTTIMVTP